MPDVHDSLKSQADFLEEITSLKRQKLFAWAYAKAEAAQARFPDDPAWIVERAWIAWDIGNFDHSAAIWRELRQRVESPHISHLIGQGVACHRAGLFAETEAVYAEAIELFPPHLEVLINLAWNAEAQGRDALALERWLNVRTHFPEAPEPYRRMAQSLWGRGLFTEADAILRDGIARLPDNADLCIDYAWCGEKQGDLAETLKRWESVRSRFAHRPEGHWATAKTLLDLGRFADAEVLLAPSRRLFPDDQHVLEISGWVATRQRSVEKAGVIWAEFRQRFPDETAGYLGWISVLRMDERLSDAEAMLAVANERFPNHREILLEWAQVLTDRKDWGGALRRWTIASEAFPQSEEAYHGLVRALNGGGSRDEAKRTFLEGEARFEKSFSFEARALDIAAEIFDRDIVIKRGADLIARFPHEHESFTALGRILRKLGELDRCIAMLEKAMVLFPDVLDMKIEYARSLSEKRDWAAALPLWAALKKANPSNGALRDLIGTYLWKARQDHSLLFFSGHAETGLFEIPEELGDISAGDDQQDLRDLFMQFESIGVTCEFGMVQRRFGAEPLGLLRWTTAKPEPLTAALMHGFDGFGDPDQTVVDIVNGEYMTRDKRYHLFAHTFTMATNEPVAEFSAQQCKRIEFLRRKFMSDLGAGKKLYVYVEEPNIPLADAQVHAVYDALRQHAPDVKLLCVRPHAAPDMHGEIERARDGLFFGYIDKVSTVDISMDHWVTLCRKTVAAISDLASE